MSSKLGTKHCAHVYYEPLIGTCAVHISGIGIIPYMHTNVVHI